MMPPVLFALAGCLAVNASHQSILPGDLLPAFPAMAGLPPDTAVAAAPAPGVARVFRAPELRMLGARFHIEAPAADRICVWRPVYPLQPERLREAMRRSLPDARVELLDYSRQPAPEGDLEFPLSGLRPSLWDASAAVLWMGEVRFAGRRRFGIWARAKVAVHVRRVLATADLHPDKPITPGEVRAVEREESFTAEPYPASVEEVAGKCPQVAIRAGSAIRAAQLQPARDVLRGDAVVVEVRNGAARLKLEARAEGSGAAGDTIVVQNPESHRRFRARVEGKGLVSVEAPGVNP